MINKIIVGISKKLYETFGSEYTIYTENVEQNLQEPCFLIELVNSSRKKLPGSRYISTNQFDICYFSNASEQKNNLHNIANELFEALEYITLQNLDLLHATDMHYEIVDDVLHFLINYNMILRLQPQEINYMQEIEIHNQI